MNTAHQIILFGGALGVVSIFAGAFAARFKAPLLLVFLCLGMLAGEDGLGGIAFHDFGAAYLLGSLALAVILFEGGLKTHIEMVKTAIWPSLMLATVGVLITAAGIGLLALSLFHLSWSRGLLIGAAVAPTDAAAVATLLRLGKFKLPYRVMAILELESGLNDPISVFLMVLAVSLVQHPGALTASHAVILIIREMGGGAVIGIAGGYGLLWLLKVLKAEKGIFPVLTFTGALAIFGGAQCVEASGFLAIYLAGFIVNRYPHHHADAIEAFFDAISWVAQIGLFLLLGLLVVPHQILAVIKPALVVSFALIFLARPLAGFVCLIPFRVPLPEIGFISWVGLRGAAPIYLTIIPVLSGLPRGHLLFELVFAVVVTSLVVQGWTVGFVARILGFNKNN